MLQDVVHNSSPRFLNSPVFPSLYMESTNLSPCRWKMHFPPTIFNGESSLKRDHDGSWAFVPSTATGSLQNASGTRFRLWIASLSRHEQTSCDTGWCRASATDKQCRSSDGSSGSADACCAGSRAGPYYRMVWWASQCVGREELRGGVLILELCKLKYTQHAYVQCVDNIFTQLCCKHYSATLL